MNASMQTVQHFIDDGAGWNLSLYETHDAERLDRSRRPVVIVPGYGMNSFIFSYHPSGLSMEGYLVQQGFEVWRADLRGQGDSKRLDGTEDYGLRDLALTDLSAVTRAIFARTRSRADRVDVIGASLGGTIMFAHMALCPEHRFGSLVAMGSPVRWVDIHPLLRAAFASPALAGALRFRGTRQLAKLLVPHVLRKAPSLLSIYMNPETMDTSAIREMVNTVEDPSRHINREIAHWIARRDLVLDGVNVSDALGEVARPLLCILATGDGIVPRSTAEFPYSQVSSSEKKLIEVGDQAMRMAHADMFISRQAQEIVFAPMARWLAEQGSGGGR